MLALLRWQKKDKGRREDASITVNMRTDSQDAWVFQAPFKAVGLLEFMDFPLGVPRCDNRMVYLLEAANYTVLDPVFAVRAIEQQSQRRPGELYDTKHSVFGSVKNLFISDLFHV